MKNYMRTVFVFVVIGAFLFGCSHIPVNDQPPPKKEEPTAKSKMAPLVEYEMAPLVKYDMLQPKIVALSPPPPPSSQASASKQAEPVNVPPSPMPIKVTPLTTFYNASTARENYFRNSYTRILVTSTLDGDAKDAKPGANGEKVDILPYNTRIFLRRLFWGFKRDINLTVKIKIGEYESTSPLITLSQQSNREGEFWSRSVSHKLLDYPLFLVKEDGGASVPDIRISLAGSKNYESNMAGIALQVATTAIQQVNPTTKVLTKLTEQSTKDTARAIDGAIGKLFSNGIKEEHISDCDLRTWDNKSGVRIELNIPVEDDGNWDSKLHSVGTWTINFDEPRPSIFSDRRICKDGNLCSADRTAALKKVYEEINPGQVLNYALVKSGNGLGTIRAYILQQKWFVASLTAFKDPATGADAAKKAELQTANEKNAETLCRNIYDEITGLGLNGDDANIVIWAILKGLPEAAIIDSKAVDGADTCKAAKSAVTPAMIPPVAPAVKKDSVK